jgi:hypothetical protein
MMFELISFLTAGGDAHKGSVSKADLMRGDMEIAGKTEEEAAAAASQVPQHFDSTPNPPRGFPFPPRPASPPHPAALPQFFAALGVPEDEPVPIGALLEAAVRLFFESLAAASRPRRALGCTPDSGGTEARLTL